VIESEWRSKIASSAYLLDNHDLFFVSKLLLLPGWSRSWHNADTNTNNTSSSIQVVDDSTQVTNDNTNTKNISSSIKIVDDSKQIQENKNKIIPTDPRCIFPDINSEKLTRHRYVKPIIDKKRIQLEKIKDNLFTNLIKGIFR